MTAPYIPPVFVEAETTPPPPTTLFRRRPSSELQIGFLVLMDGVIYRVADVRKHRKLPRIDFVFHPVAGGRPIMERALKDQWRFSIVAVCPHCHGWLYPVDSQVECRDATCPMEKQTLDRDQYARLTSDEIAGYGKVKAMVAERHRARDNR